MRFSLDKINQMPRSEFVVFLGSVVEHSPWVAEQLWDDHRPFESILSLHQTIVGIVEAAGPQVWIEVLRQHPELSGKEADEGTLTKFSVTEQSGLGLNQLPKEDYFKIRDFNRQYRDKFGFPFVVCVRLLKSRDELYGAQNSRLSNTSEIELRKGIEQVYEIARLRLETLIEVTK